MNLNDANLEIMSVPHRGGKPTTIIKIAY